MKTTTTNKMQRAHEMTRATIARRPICYGLTEDGKTQQPASYAATFSEALRIVWSGSEQPLTRADWPHMDGEKQLDALRNMTYYAKSHDDARRTPDGRDLPPVLDWAKNPGDLETVANEAFCIMAEQEERADPAQPLALALYRAVTLAAVRIMRETIRHGTTRRPDKNAASGESIDARRVDERATDPEHATIIRDALERCAADDLDARIMAAIGAGYTKQETADALHKNKNTITARNAKQRERWEEWKRA